MNFRRVISTLSLIPIFLFIIGSAALPFYEGDLKASKDIVRLILEFNLTSPLLYFSLGILTLMIIVFIYISLIIHKEIREGGHLVFLLGTLAFLLILSLFLNLII